MIYTIQQTRSSKLADILRKGASHPPSWTKMVLKCSSQAEGLLSSARHFSMKVWGSVRLCHIIWQPPNRRLFISSFPLMISELLPIPSRSQACSYLLSEARSTLANTSSSQNSPPSWQRRPCWYSWDTNTQRLKKVNAGSQGQTPTPS